MTLGLFALVVVGGALLIVGAELLVRGGSRLAVAAGISPLVVGLTVVAFGTSSPELAVTVESALGGAADVALGNVVGSNIFNVLFILGLSALIAPLIVSEQLVRLDVPLMIGVSLLTWFLAADGVVGRTDGALLVTGIVTYTVALVWQSRRASTGRTAYEDALDVDARPKSSWPLDVGLVVGGLVLLVVGSRWLVEGAVRAAQAMGVSELVIGLTIVAAGTSLPEVATSVTAALRGQRDIAVGNVVGSNIFNLLAVLGLGSVLSPAGIPVSPGALTFDIPVMTAAAVAALPIFFTGYVIARWEGATFLGFYGVYTVYLVLDAAGHPFMDDVRGAMLGFVLPLTALTLLVIGVRAIRRT